VDSPIRADRYHPQRRTQLRYDDGAPTIDPAVLDIAPTLAICYGMQLVAHISHGDVINAGRNEYGRAQLAVEESSGLFDGFRRGER